MDKGEAGPGSEALAVPQLVGGRQEVTQLTRTPLHSSRAES